MSNTVLQAQALPAQTYWTQSRQPLASLLFISPLLITYELGVVSLGPLAVRNGADAWLRFLLDSIGFGQYFLLPILTVCVLLAWHHTTHQPWRVPGRIFYGMAAESLLAAGVLLGILHLQGQLLHVAAEWRLVVGGGEWMDVVRTRVGYLGAGIYEELMFRLLLLSFFVLGLRVMGLGGALATVAAIVVSSLLFSWAHYWGARELFSLFSFLFRFLAGVFFSLLFLYRGFGIAVAAHAGYDILVGFL